MGDAAEARDVRMPEPAPLPLVALTPTELAATQSSLEDWCSRKLAELEADRRDISANHAIAKKQKWRTKGFESQLSLVKRRIVFYEKVKLAVQAGYLLIPNFPVEAFAVRRDGTPPPYSEASWHTQVADNPPMKLPAGEGDYVSPTPLIRHDVEHPVVRSDGKTEIEKWWRNVGIGEIEFPVALAQPRVLDATQKAMALRIFDRIGLVGPNRRKHDPIVVGQILDPRSTMWNRRELTFFIAWFLDYRMI